MVIPRLAGSTWVGLPALTGGMNTPPNINAVTFGGGLFVAVGQGGVIYTGTYLGIGDITWTQQVSNTTANLNGVVWAGTLFLAIGDGGNEVYSADTVTWYPVNTGFNVNLHAVTLASGYVAVGDNGTIITSADAITWVRQGAGVTTQTLNGVFNASGNIMAMGANGTLLRSLDAVTWVPQALPAPASSANLRSIAFGYNLVTPVFVVVGDGGTLVTSIDLVHYIQLPALGADLHSIWYGSQFVSVGSGGHVFYSPDGFTWAAGTVSPPVGNLNAAVFGNGCYVTVGDAGGNADSH